MFSRSRYASLYKEEKAHLGCRTRTYKAMFTWKYLGFLGLLIACIIVNYILLFVMYDKLFAGSRGESTFDFTGFKAVYHDASVLASGLSARLGIMSDADGGNSTVLNQTDVGNQTMTSLSIGQLRCKTNGAGSASDDDISEADCLYYFRLTVYIQVVDWTFTAVYLIDLLVRWYCTKFSEFLRVKYHYLDLLLVAIDGVFVVLQYTDWFEVLFAVDMAEHVKYVQVLRSIRLLRIITLYTLYRNYTRNRSAQWSAL